MTELSVVPAPASISARESAAFPLDAQVRIEGDADAAAVLTALLEARTGLEVGASASAEDDARVIRLDVDKGSGDAESTSLSPSAS